MKYKPAKPWGPCRSDWGAKRACPEADRVWWRRPLAAHPVTLRTSGTASREDVRSPKMARLEAALLVATSAMTPRKLAQVATLSGAREVRELVARLNASYERCASSFRIESVASGYQMLTLPDYAGWLDRLHHRQARLKLSAPAMETLSILAYKQPATRADIEAVRGVKSSEMLKQLMEHGLVKIVGEDDSLGKPYLYGTTRRFLEYFGLTSLDDLPMAETLRQPAVEARSLLTEEASSPADDLAGESQDPVDPVPVLDGEAPPPEANDNELSAA